MDQVGKLETGPAPSERMVIDEEHGALRTATQAPTSPMKPKVASDNEGFTTEDDEVAQQIQGLCLRSADLEALNSKALKTRKRNGFKE